MSAKRESWEKFLSCTYEDPKRFAMNVAHLLRGDMHPDPKNWRELLRAFHPLSHSNRRGAAIAELCRVFEVEPREAFKHYNSLPYERRAELNEIVDGAIAAEMPEMMPDILHADPDRTKRLLQYEAEFRDLLIPLFVHPPQFPKAGTYEFMLVPLFSEAWSIRVQDIIRTFKSLPQRSALRMADKLAVILPSGTDVEIVTAIRQETPAEMLPAANEQEPLPLASLTITEDVEQAPEPGTPPRQARIRR